MPEEKDRSEDIREAVCRWRRNNQEHQKDNFLDVYEGKPLDVYLKESGFNEEEIERGKDINTQIPVGVY